MVDLSAFILAGRPVAGSTWRNVRSHDPVTVTAGAAGAPWVDLDTGARWHVFLRSFEPVLGRGDWLDEALLRAEVRALTMVAPTDRYPLTLATSFQGRTPAEQWAALVTSHGFFCADCGPADLREETEVLRFDQPGRCRCGEPTRWFHAADEARVSAHLVAFSLCPA